MFSLSVSEETSSVERIVGVCGLRARVVILSVFGILALFGTTRAGRGETTPDSDSSHRHGAPERTPAGTPRLAESYGKAALNSESSTNAANAAGNSYFADDALNTPPSFSFGGMGAAPTGQMQTPIITWPMPAPITTATPLSAAQLDATATDANGNSVPGTFVYTPAAGATLPAGTQTLSVTFTPTNTTVYTDATGSTTIVVTQAAAITTNTTLTITPGTVGYEQPVTLSARVQEFNGTPVTTGQVYFCETTAGACNLQKNVGVAPVNGSATAVLRLSPGTIGTHNYTANFAGTKQLVKSGSYSNYVIVTGTYPTTTTIAQSGMPGNYLLTATVVGTGSVAGGPGGSVSFLDSSNANANLGMGVLGFSTEALGFALKSAFPASVGSGIAVPGDLNGDGKLDLVFTNRETNTLAVFLGNQDGTFTQAPNLTTGSVPAALALADFNGDGNLDIAVTNEFADTVSIFLGRGDGTFTAVSATPETAAYPNGIVAGDFNGDGIADLVVTNQNDDTVTILLGNGDGTFDPNEPFETGGSPSAIVAGDFNGDGALDLAIAVDGTVNVYLGRGDGSFAFSAYAEANGISPRSIAVGDVNNDGKLDLVVADDAGYPDSQGAGAVYVLLGNGDGTFTAAANPTVGNNPSGMVVTDLNQDGNLDLAVVSVPNNTATILLGKGDGTFTPSGGPTTGVGPTSLVAGDVNGDGFPDLVIATEGQEGLSGPAVSVLLTQLTQAATATIEASPTGAGSHAVVASYPGGGDFGASVSSATNLMGTATPMTPVITWTMPAPITTATPLSATQLDATAADTNGNAVPGTFAYTPAAGTMLAAGTQTLSVVFTPTDTADFTTATGTTTIVVTQAGVSSGPATTTGLYTVQNTVAYGQPVQLQATVETEAYGVLVGQVVFCNAAEPECDAAHNLAIAQLNNNANATAYVSAGPIGVNTFIAKFLGTTGGERPGAPSTSGQKFVTVTGTYPSTATIAATGAGGTYGLTGTVVGYGTHTAGPTGTVSFLDTSNANALLGSGALGASTPGFALGQSKGSPVAVGTGAYGAATGDFNGDGFQDAVVANDLDGTVSVLLGKGDGTFQPQVTYPVGSQPEKVSTADLNGDGFLDLIVANEGDNTIGVLLGKGDGTFQAQVTYPCVSPVGLGVMDINHDGFPDVVASDYFTASTMSVLLGNGDGTLRAAVTYATGSFAEPVAEGDFNGDGNVDVVIGNMVDETVGILLGNGDGTFQTMVTYAVGNLPLIIQAGDFNEDGKQDLAVTNGEDNTVSVLLGNGDGSFKPQVTYAVGDGPRGLAIADFNGDGHLDLTVGNEGGTGTQSVLLGNGDGTFQPQVTFAPGILPYAVAVADFNGDGLPDMALTTFSGSTAAILLSQVTQTASTPATTVTVGGGANAVHNVEASYPGDTSFAATVSATTALAGTTVQATPTITWAMPAAITTTTPLSATQLDATATDANGNAVPGTFAYTPAAGTVLAAGTQTLSVVFTPTDTVDFTTATGTTTILVTQAGGGAPSTTTLSITAGEGQITEVAAGKVVTLTAMVSAAQNSVSPGRVAFCDATAAMCIDNHLLATAQLIPGDTTSMATYRFVPGIGTHSYKAVFLGKTGGAAIAASASEAAALTVTGKFPSATTIAQSGSAGSYLLTATTVGIGDPAAAPAGTVSFLDSSNNNAVLATGTLGAGTAGLSFAGKSSAANMEGPQTRSAVADFNGDGILDIATASSAPNFGTPPTAYANTVTISLGNGDGTFTTLSTYPATGTHPESIVAGDFNGDGRADLAVTNFSDGTVTILIGNGDGTFAAGTTVGVAQNAYGLVTGDFNGDGNLDLAVSGGNEVVILLGNGDGTFTGTPVYLTDGTLVNNEGFGPIITGDFNGDGKADLIVEGYSPRGELIVLLGDGNGGFSAGAPITLPGQGSNQNNIVAGDFNGDGKMDFAATNSSQNTILIMTGNGDGTFVMTPAASGTDYDPIDIQAGDFDGDGKLDLAVQRLSYNGQEVLLGNGDGTFTIPVIQTGVYGF